jgi:glycosyltransferase involved in cell wall biosynthesis
LDLVIRLEEASQGKYLPWLIFPKERGLLVDAVKDLGIACSVVPMPNALLEMSRRQAVTSPIGSFFKSLSLIPQVLSYMRDLENALAQNPSALIHTTGIKCHVMGAIVGKKTGTPVLWHLRDILSRGPSLYVLRAIERACSPHVVSNSRATAEGFFAKAERSWIVHNGLDPSTWARSQWQDERDRLRQEMGAQPNMPLIGVVGVLARWKGQLEFLRMARNLLNHGVKARFAVVGGEIYDTIGDRGFGLELREEARRLGISGHVHFTGHVPNPGKYIQALDILIHCSLKPEPFGRVITEAMALEVPIVAAADGGVLEIVRNGHSALLYPPGDIEAMARAVSQLVQDPGLCGSMIQKARAEFLERFTVDRYVRGVTQVYDQILGS